MPKMTDRELLAVVEAEFSNAMGESGGEISTERAKAWDYYMSKPLGNEIQGQSQIVTSDVSDVVDGIMPSLLRIFTTAENLVDFDAVGPEDEARAQQESDYVNFVFFKHNPAFIILFTWFFDALVQKNGIVKAWWDDSEKVSSESYRGLTDAELAELFEDDELEAVEQEKREEDVPVSTVDPATGLEATILVPATVHDVKFRRVTERGRVKIEAVPPEEYRISADARTVDPCDARMVGQECEKTRSELLEMGFDKDIVDDLPAHGEAKESSEEIGRRDKTDESDDAPQDPSQDKILVKEAYIKVDYDGDGRSELRQVMTAGGQILLNEESDRQPFHVITPQPLSHKHFGRAVAERVMDVQEVNTTLTRQVLDNLYHTNNPSHAVWEMGMGEHTLDDLLTTRVGSVKRFARPVQESYQPISIPFTAAQTFPMLEFWDRVKRDRTGVSSDGEGLNPEALKNIQTTVLAQASDMSRMKQEAVVRVFAETGIKSLFRHIHELLLKHQDKETVAKLRGQWVPVNPAEWRTREDMTVKIGLGIGTREQNLLHLNAIWEKQADMVQAGGLGLTVTPKNIYNTAAEVVKNANMKDPAAFFTDPGDAQPQQEGDGTAELQAQLAQAQIQLQEQEQMIDRERNAAKHEQEMLKLQLQQQKQADDMTVAMEQIANKLTELELKYGENVPGSRV